MPSSKFLIGPGKVEALAQCVATEQIDVALFDCALSGAQERNLEHSLGCRVLDRTGLILVIFALRARSHEGKLQVELAQLEHMSTRLVRGWSHLDRQKGGIGLRGAGEKQLELDQRMLRARMRSIRSRLDQVRKQRAQGRRSRARAELPTLSLVGYTNSGKSTLFNRLTQAGVYAADQLFATLDSTLRRVEWPELGPAVLADTVGFIRDLPHQLVDAFHATLEETQAADLLLQVVDASDPDHDTHHLEVEAVLAEIGACDRPRLWVYNKIDALSDSRPRIDRDAAGTAVRVWISAREGCGIDLLQQAITERLVPDLIDTRLSISPAHGRLRARLYDSGAVVEEDTDAAGQFVLHLRGSGHDLARLFRSEGLELDRLNGRSDVGQPRPGH